jgi:hypothetical protein
VTIIFVLVRLSGDPVKMKGEIGADPAYLQQIRHDWVSTVRSIPNT